MEFTIYSFFYLLTSVVSITLAFVSIQRKAVVGAWELFYLSFFVAFNTYFCFFESMAETLSMKVFWSSVAYIGGAVIPVFYLLFILRFTKLIKFKNISFGWFLFVFPLITIVMAFTNNEHHLLWSGFSEIDADTNIMTYKHGFWFWIGYTLYSYLILMVATYFLIEFLYKNRKKRAYQRQGVIVTIGGLIPWISSVMYVSGESPFHGLDVAPISTLISSSFFTYAILSSSLINFIPVARETLVETLPIGIMALDNRDRIQDINEVAGEFLGINMHDVLGVDVRTKIGLPEKLIPSLLSRTSPVQIEHELNGIKHHFKIMKNDIKSVPGSRLITIQDITDPINKQIELEVAFERAEESERLKSAFLANMSHEIRTPMNGIMGFVSLLQRDDITNQERGQYLEIIRKNCDRLLITLNDIIDLSKIEANVMPLNYSDLDMHDFLQTISELFTPEAKLKNIDFFVSNSLPGPLCLIRTDKTKIYAILSNLVKNAIKYTHDGYVKVTCEISDTMLCIHVEDTGIGIPESKVNQVFKSFVQGTSDNNRTYEGSGLGLAITKAYVEMLQGTLTLNSTENVGSQFLVTLPVKILDFYLD